jgi:hypothetical protein
MYHTWTEVNKKEIREAALANDVTKSPASEVRPEPTLAHKAS